MLIFQCILGLQSQSIDSTNAFAQADITSEGTVFIEFPRDFMSDGRKHDAIIRENKSYVVQPKPHAYDMKSCEIIC